MLAGINAGFFDSNDGFGRGMHIEEGEPVFINNQSVRKSLVNHTWAFTLFTDGTASCGKKEFSGKMEIAGKEYEYFSVNDTIVRNGSKTYYANLYTSRYKVAVEAKATEALSKLASSTAATEAAAKAETAATKASTTIENATQIANSVSTILNLFK